MRTTLDYQSGKLNAGASTTASGAADVITGLSISTGTNSGDFVELTDAQALQLSKTTVGTLYSGIYQRVKLSTAAAGGTTAPVLGQAVFWNASDATDPYATTNVPNFGGNQNYNWAGVVIDPAATAGQYFWIQVNGHATLLTNGAGANGQIVGFPVTSTNQFVLTATALTTGSEIGVQTSLASGAAGIAQAIINVYPTKL